MKTPLTEDPLFRILVDAGHSAFKACEIILDARRGDEFSKLWIQAASGTLYQANECRSVAQVRS